MKLFKVLKKEIWLISDSDPAWSSYGEPEVSFSIYKTTYYSFLGLSFKCVDFLRDIKSLTSYSEASEEARKEAMTEMLNVRLGYIDRKNGCKPVLN